MMEKIMAKKSFYKIEMLFLKVLEQEDCYGYQLTQSIQDITNGQIKIAEGIPCIQFFINYKTKVTSLIDKSRLENAKPEFTII